MAHGEGIPFGKYRLARRLARGGMAEVFLATQSGPDGFRRRVAVKRILPHLADSEEFVGMFLDEARLAAALSHPHIVHVYDFGKVEEYYFITMEFVDGVDAGRLIKESAREPIPPEIVARILADAAAGLHHAHQLTDATGRPAGIVHRDISPQNLLISYDGVVKVVDFGIAKAASQAERTRPGVVKGKFAYMSPEQVVGKPLDGRSDVFSLAVVGWEMLAGRYIVSREDPSEAMRLIRDGKLPRIETVRPGVPAPLCEALARAMTRDPRQRPSAAEMGVELETYLKGAAGLATSLAVAEWVRAHFPREMTGPVAAMPGAPGGAGAGGGTVAGTQAATAGTIAGTVAGTQAASSGGISAGTEAGTEAGTGSEWGAGAGSGSGGGAGAGAGAAVAARPATNRLTEVDAAPPMPHSGTELAPALRRGRRSVLIALGAAAAATLVGLALVLSGVVGGGEPEKPMAERPAPPAPAVPAPAPSVTPIAPPSEADAAPVAEVPPIPDGAATLEVITEPPGASLSLDGEELGTPTPAVLVAVEPGEHRLVVRLDGHRPIERVLTLEPNDRRTLELTLTPEPGVATAPPNKPPANARKGSGGPRAVPSSGYLTVKTIPYSEVYLGKRKLGTTPLAELELPAGTHTLTFKNPDKGAVRRKVTIRPGATTKVSFEL